MCASHCHSISFFIFMEILADERHHQRGRVKNEMLFLMFSHPKNSTKENREHFNMWCRLFNACSLLLSHSSFDSLIIFRLIFSLPHTH